jgi:type 1 glutamine amidotransferase
MKPFSRIAFILVGFGLVFSGAIRAADTAMPSKKKVLVFSKSSGFEHEAIKLKMKDGRPGYAFAVIEEIGRKNNIEFTFSKDGSLFTPEYLAQFDAYLFYTTGDLTLARNDAKDGDDNPPMTAAGKQALLDAIAGGKGFIGVHSATDTFHSPGNKDHGRPRNQDDGANADPYVKMIGAEFIKHDSQQKAHLIVADAKFPGISAVPADFGPNEEWYSLKDFAPDMHVLLVQDTSTMHDPSYARPPYPSTWARLNGKGRVFYTNMGHREDIWTNPVFQSVLAGGLDWALRRVDADVTPNLAQVAPQASVLPAFVEPPPPKSATPAPAAAPAKP